MKQSLGKTSYSMVCATQFVWVAIALFFTISLQAQNNTNLLPSKETYLQLITQQEKSNAAVSNVKALAALLTQKQDAIYIDGNTLKQFGEKPKIIFVSLADYRQLQAPSLLRNHVELIQFTVSTAENCDVAALLESLAAFKNLKYIHFIVQSETDQRAIATSLSQTDWPYASFYSSSSTEHD